LLLGAHASVAGGLARAFERGATDGCEAIQIFTRSGRAWASKPLTASEVADFERARTASEVPVVAHGSYLVNLANPDPILRGKSLACFRDEVERVELLGVGALIFHPGSNPDTEQGLELVAEALRQIIAATPRFNSQILIESTAGQGACLGHRFEHLAELLQRVGNTRRVGICLDTCHLYAAGYDLKSKAGYAKVMREFDRVVGLEHVRAFHLNDCLKPLGCRVDRHADLGEGTLGMAPFERLVNDAQFAQTIAVLETPHPENYVSTLARLRGLRKRKSSARGRLSRPVKPSRAARRPTG
jgi:deoxyribonuclease-4